MKYCTYCGEQLEDDAKFCSNCGKQVLQENIKHEEIKDEDITIEDEKPKDNSTKIKINTKRSDIITVIKVFLILSTVLQGLALIPLLWCIPMTISLFNKMKNNEEISLVFKILTFIFVSRVAGICLLILEIDDIK